ncbi:MAG: ABC transporter ATP-binding protein [Candidatus Omnitrophota bacterium]
MTNPIHSTIQPFNHSTSSDIAIKVEHVAKKYCKSLKRSMIYGMQDIARNTLGLRAQSERLRKEEFWALDNISFEVKKGETLGIIGPNGSGKTTLLKMLNGIFWPDKGKISIRGRVGALIEVGAGFHPLLTGRENIYLNAAILGMTKKEVNDKFDSIVEFADIGDFIDSPVKFYSSGMFVRLGFAVAVHCEPEILLVDEVLAVGDKEFSIKCYQKIHEIKKRGATVIIVSHNEYTIREQTENCLYIEKGETKFYGSSEEAISIYIKDRYEQKSKNISLKKLESYPVSKKAKITSLNFFDSNCKEISYLESGQELNIVFGCIIHETLHNPIFGVNFYDNSGFMYCANSDYEKIEFQELPPKKIKIKITILNFHLPVNSYFCSTIIAEGNAANLIDLEYMKYRIVVGRAKNSRGSLKLPTKWKIETL